MLKRVFFPSEKCHICGKSKKGKLNCCSKGGSWEGKCGDSGEKEYTWIEGAEACQNEPPKPPTTDGMSPKPPTTHGMCL